MTVEQFQTLQVYFAEQIAIVDRALNECVPSEKIEPSSIHRAMRYSLFAGGKRIRPILAIAAARAISAESSGVENAAATLELIHTYSLIHDDLPALDNDDLRRGRPTCHKVFGDAMAILACDALLTLAFEVLSRLRGIAPERQVLLVQELSQAAGTMGGMIGGQVHDIEGERQQPTVELLTAIHRAKTGAALQARGIMSALYAGGRSSELEALSEYGEHVGLAFQIIDDVLDVEESSEALGKTAGKDQAQQKVTFPAVYGLARSREMAEEERAAAHEALRMFDQNADPLRHIADFIVHRKA